MNNNIYPLLFLFITLISCENEEVISFSSESITETSLESCGSDPCPEITINYVKVAGESSAVRNINTKIERFIVESLYLGDDTSEIAGASITEAMQHFVAMNRADSAEFTEIQSKYFAEVSVDELYVSNELICFQLRNYIFAGGAHGFGSVSFLNIDPATGNDLPSEKIITDKEAFSKLVEQRFRKEFDIPSEAPINSTGFWFENDTFHLPETIGFTNDTVILRYNQYEIASYAAGPIEIEIPLQQLAPFLTIN